MADKTSKLKNEQTEALMKAILTLETVEECYDFFKDLCTFQELREMAQRFRVATMLHEGNVYETIVKATGASTATISRVNRSMIDGNEGYALVFERLAEEKPE
ncbi:MAG: TrpR-like protein, YerC/YecD [Clostridia bacterium]|nr:TrpR-like protein, YerC/YecD [Clostridia bacterium]